MLCYLCNKPGHKKINCPTKRFESLNNFNQNYFKPHNNAKNSIKYENQMHMGPRNKNYRENQILNSGANTKSKIVNFVGRCDENLFYKNVMISGIVLNGLIDTGSECSLIKKSLVDFLKLSDIDYGIRRVDNAFYVIKTLSGNTVEVNEVITCNLCIDSVSSQEEFLVVPENCCPADVLSRNTFIKRPYISLFKVGHEIKFFNPMNIPSVNLLRSGASKSRQELNSQIINCEQNNSDILELLRQYRDCVALNLSEMGKTTHTAMNIKLTSEKPIAYNP